jgi:NADPH-dependent glutamate synthase beta subunit-like oxidoreductase
MKALDQAWGVGPNVAIDMHQGMVGPPPNVYGRYDRAQTPDGKTYPVCFTLGNNDEDGIEKRPGPQPGTVHTNRWARLTAVKRFVFKEPPRPKE